MLQVKYCYWHCFGVKYCCHNALIMHFQIKCMWNSFLLKNFMSKSGFCGSSCGIWELAWVSFLNLPIFNRCSISVLLVNVRTYLWFSDLFTGYRIGTKVGNRLINQKWYLVFLKTSFEVCVIFHVLILRGTIATFGRSFEVIEGIRLKTAAAKNYNFGKRFWGCNFV